MSSIEIGRLLRSGINGFAVGCRVSNYEIPVFGGLVRASLGGNLVIYGIIYDIHIDDDGLVRQLVTANEVNNEVIEDNRINRNVPLEISVMTVGYGDENNQQIYHLLPPRVPLSLDTIQLCTPLEICEFTGLQRFGYFRHILRNKDLPISEIIASHLQQANNAHNDNGDWTRRATQELITLLRDDYPTLMAVLSALGDALEI